MIHILRSNRIKGKSEKFTGKKRGERMERKRERLTIPTVSLVTVVNRRNISYKGKALLMNGVPRGHEDFATPPPPPSGERCHGQIQPRLPFLPGAV